MTTRELRNRRRAAERSARKTEQKQLASLNLPATHLPSHEDLGVSPETLQEFGPEFIAHANAIRDRVHRQAAQPLPTPDANVPVAASSIVPAALGRSGGPRTPSGKAISSRNSFRHGLASGAIVIPGEDPAAFEALVHDLLADHPPANATEELLVHEMAQAYWLMQRASRLQNACFTGGEVDCKQLALFLRYRTTYERSFHKSLGTLIALKKQRERASRQDEAAPLSAPKIQAQDEAASLSAPKIQPQFVSQSRPGHGFVSQKSPDNRPSSEFVRQNDLPSETHGQFVSQNASPIDPADHKLPQFTGAA